MVLALAAVALFALTCWVDWPFRLDDTFIHLRYAENLMGGHGLTYNADETSYGTSSVLYVALLSFVGRYVELASWPSLAKIISIAGNAAAVLILLQIILATRRGRPVTRTALWLVCAPLMLAVPASARWLQDGMETSIGVALALLAGAVVVRNATRTSGIFEGILFGVVVSLPGLFRLDWLSISFATLAILWVINQRKSLPVLVSAVSFLLLWYGFLYHLTGSLAPDSAVAKQAGHFIPNWPLAAIKTTGSVSPMWLIGAVGLLWVLLAPTTSRRTRMVCALGLLPILLTVVAGTAVGQAIQGARYFLTGLAFCCGILLFVESDIEIRPLPTFVIAGAMVLSIAHAILIQHQLNRVLSSWQLTNVEDLQRPGQLVAAEDIGRIGWYSSARILDLSGLVNGHVLAKTPPAARFCVGQKLEGTPTDLVLTDAQAKARGQIDGHLRLVCPDAPPAEYLNSHRAVMSGTNLGGPLTWTLWTRER
jgi:hypothetical protein